MISISLVWRFDGSQKTEKPNRSYRVDGRVGGNGGFCQGWTVVPIDSHCSNLEKNVTISKTYDGRTQ
jgi:hypothetical protein